MPSNTGNKIHLALLLPSRVDSNLYTGDNNQYPYLFLCLFYKIFKFNCPCLRATLHLNTSSNSPSNMMKGPVPEIGFNSCMNRIKISKIKVEVHSISYEK